jgi:hypothetical protein
MRNPKIFFVDPVKTVRSGSIHELAYFQEIIYIIVKPSAFRLQLQTDIFQQFPVFVQYINAFLLSDPDTVRGIGT